MKVYNAGPPHWPGRERAWKDMQGSSLLGLEVTHVISPNRPLARTRHKWSVTVGGQGRQKHLELLKGKENQMLAFQFQ